MRSITGPHPHSPISGQSWSNLAPTCNHHGPLLSQQAVPQLGVRLGVCRLAMQTLMDCAKATKAGSSRDIRLVGRLFVSKASAHEGASVDQMQVDKAEGLGFSLYLHTL